jgi:hypothetical protein
MLGSQVGSMVALQDSANKLEHEVLQIQSLLTEQQETQRFHQETRNVEAKRHASSLSKAEATRRVLLGLRSDLVQLVQQEAHHNLALDIHHVETGKTEDDPSPECLKRAQKHLRASEALLHRMWQRDVDLSAVSDELGLMKRLTALQLSVHELENTVAQRSRQELPE